MALSDIKRFEWETKVFYCRAFDYVGHEGWGFSFDCDEHGNVLPFTPDQAPAAESYRQCLTGRVGDRLVVDKGVERFEHSYRPTPYGTCQCGAIVYLDGDTRGEGIDCVCGRIYNSGGQELRPRDQWEENYDDDY